MKKFFRYLNIATLFIVLSAVFAACSDNDDNGDGNLGLNIKVFAPTVVVPGTPMTINGSGFGDVTEINFPGDITVTDFEIVTNEMIRVKAPQNLTTGGTISVRNSAGEVAESRLALTVGKTKIVGYSPNEAGTLLKSNQTLTAYGSDMQFVTSAEFLDEDGNPVVIPASEFYRVAPGRAVVIVPANVYEGNAVVKFSTSDGQVYTSPEYKFEQVKQEEGGHWDIKRIPIWENDGTVGAPSWSGEYRFSNEEAVSGEEIAAIPMDIWNTYIKEGEFCFLFDGADNSNVRITTGWWDATYGGGEFNSYEYAEDDPETGKKIIRVNIKSDGNMYDLVDAHHLLFTGSDYTPVSIFYEEKTWVEGGGQMVEVENVFWTNGVESTIPAPSWSGEGRFCVADAVSGEETFAFDAETWGILKDEPFRIMIEKTGDADPNVRITTGWWDATYGGGEHNSFEEAEEIGDGKYFIEINMPMYGDFYDLVDSHHLLFTGSDYKLLKIYQVKTEWVGGGGSSAKPIEIWSNDGTVGAPSWSGEYRFSNEEAVSGEEIAAIPMDLWNKVIKDGEFYISFAGGDNSNVRITTGWWDATFGGAEFNSYAYAEDDPENPGMKRIKVNIKADGNMYDLVDSHHLLFTGSDYTPMKIYYYE